jgi:Phage T7 tail fibre protein
VQQLWSGAQIELLSVRSSPTVQAPAFPLGITPLAGSAAIASGYGGTSWSFTGDGTATVFSIPGAYMTGDGWYWVAVDGVWQLPTTDYSVNPATHQITFTTAPPSGTVIDIRSL